MNPRHLTTLRPRPLCVHLDAPFLSLTFVFSWTCWLPAAFALIPSHWNSRLHLIGALDPMVEGGICARNKSREMLRALHTRFRLRRFDWPWIATAAAISIFLYLIGAGMVGATGRTHAAHFTAQNAELPYLSFSTYVLVSLGFYGFGEEVEWRGWWLPKLRSTLSPRHSALIQRLAWVLWHIPLLFILPGFRTKSGWMLFRWALCTFSSAALFAWLFKFTKWSVVVAVFHTMVDVAFLASPHPAVCPVSGGMIMALAVVALVLLPGKTDCGEARGRG